MTREEQAARVLLEQAGLLARLADEPARRFGQRYAPRFNPVVVIAAETGWSKVIATLLDPEGDHGQGRLFLDGFLHEVGVDPGDFRDKVEIGTERSLVLGRNLVGRIDILITAASRVLGIEVKLDAADQPAQLARYHAALSRMRSAKPVLVYLAKPGAKPSTTSTGGLNQEQVKNLPFATEGADTASFARSLRAALRDCRAERVRLFVELVGEALERAVGVRQPIEDPRTMVITAYLRENPEHLRTALAVRDALPAVKNELLAEFAKLLEKEIRRSLADIGDDWVTEDQSLVNEPLAAYKSLSFHRRSWPDRYLLAIDRGGSSDTSRYRYGIALKEPLADTSEASSIAVNLGLDRGDEWWPCRSNLPGRLQ